MMQPATLTVVEDPDGHVASPALGVAVDLMPSERNGLGRMGELVVRLDHSRLRSRREHRIAIAVREDGWCAGAFGDQATVNGTPLQNGGWRALSPGDLLGFAG